MSSKATSSKKRGAKGGATAAAAAAVAVPSETTAGAASTVVPGTGATDAWFELILKNDASLLNAYPGNIHAVDKHGFNAMMVASMHRCPVSLMWCIRNGVGRTSIDKEERTEGLSSLMFACIAWSTTHTRVLDNPECAQILVQCGANPKKRNTKGDTPLHWAVSADFTNIVRYLASLAWDFPGLLDIANFPLNQAGGQTPLQLARSKSKKDIVEVLESAQRALLLPRTVPACVIDPTKFACDTKTLEPKIKLKKRVPAGGAGESTAASDSATNPAEETPEPLITATIGDYLCSSARRGDLNVLLRFRTYLDSVDSDGRNVLMSACVARRADVVRWYLETVPEGKRAQLLVTDDYTCSCTHFAAAGGKSPSQDSEECMRLIVEAGAHVNAVDNAGCTPLHLAAQNGFQPIVSYLLARSGCNPGAMDFFGRTAAFYASNNNQSAIAAQIQDAIHQGAVSGARATCTLFDLIADNNTEGLRSYVGNLAVRNVMGLTAVMYAAARRKLPALKWLLANVNLPMDAVNKHQERFTALMYACSPPLYAPTGGAGASGASGASGAGPSADTGPAVDSEACVALLLAHTPTTVLNTKSVKGDTALHLAARHGQTRVVQRLMQRLDIVADVTNLAGDRPVDVARKGGFDAIARAISVQSGTALLQQVAAESMMYQSALALPVGTLDVFVTALTRLERQTFRLEHIREQLETQLRERQAAGSTSDGDAQATATLCALCGSPALVRQLVTYMIKLGFLVYDDAFLGDDEHMMRSEMDHFCLGPALSTGLAWGRALTWDTLMQFAKAAAIDKATQPAGPSHATMVSAYDVTGEAVDGAVFVTDADAGAATTTTTSTVLATAAAQGTMTSLDKLNRQGTQGAAGGTVASDLRDMQRTMLTECEVAGLVTAPVFQYLASLTTLPGSAYIPGSAASAAGAATASLALVADSDIPLVDIPETLRRALAKPAGVQASGKAAKRRAGAVGSGAVAAAAAAAGAAVAATTAVRDGVEPGAPSLLAVHAALARGLHADPVTAYGAMTASVLRDAVAAYVGRVVQEATAQTAASVQELETRLGEAARQHAATQAASARDALALTAALERARKLEHDVESLRMHVARLEAQRAAEAVETRMALEHARQTAHIAKDEASKQYQAMRAQMETVSASSATVAADAARAVADAEKRAVAAETAMITAQEQKVSAENAMMRAFREQLRTALAQSRAQAQATLDEALAAQRSQALETQATAVTAAVEEATRRVQAEALEEATRRVQAEALEAQAVAVAAAVEVERKRVTRLTVKALNQQKEELEEAAVAAALQAEQELQRLRDALAATRQSADELL